MWTNGYVNPSYYIARRTRRPKGPRVNKLQEDNERLTGECSQFVPISKLINSLCWTLFACLSVKIQIRSRAFQLACFIYESRATNTMANIAAQRIKREFKEVIKSEEVG